MPGGDHGISSAESFQNLHLAWQTQADLGFHALRNLLPALAVHHRRMLDHYLTHLTLRLDALVTGAASGIGAATVARFAAEEETLQRDTSSTAEKNTKGSRVVLPAASASPTRSSSGKARCSAGSTFRGSSAP